MSSEYPSEVSISTFFFFAFAGVHVGVAYLSPLTSPPLLCLIDQQRMALNTVTEKNISYSQPLFAAIHRWSKRHHDGGDYSEAKSTIFFSRHCKAPIHKQTFQKKF